MLDERNRLLIQPVLFFEGDFNVGQFFSEQPGAEISQQELHEVKVDVLVLLVALPKGDIVSQ